MNKKFRILKVTKKGESDKFYIQKKIMFWWVKCEFPFINTHCHDINYISFYGCKIEKYVVSFSNEQEARKGIEEIKNPFIEKYRGHTIIKAYYEYNCRFSYIDISRRLKKECHFNAYDYENNIDELKKKIDIFEDQKNKPQKTYIY